MPRAVAVHWTPEEAVELVSFQAMTARLMAKPGLKDELSSLNMARQAPFFSELLAILIEYSGWSAQELNGSTCAAGARQLVAIARAADTLARSGFRADRYELMYLLANLSQSAEIQLGRELNRGRTGRVEWVAPDLGIFSAEEIGAAARIGLTVRQGNAGTSH